MSPRGKELLAYLGEQRERIATFVERLARAESPSSDPSSHAPVIGLLRKAFNAVQYKTIGIPGRRSGGQLYARSSEHRRGAAKQLLVGHFDTVWPLGTLERMPYEFDGRILRGPGVFDMKGGLAQILFAIEAIQTLGLAPSVTPVIFLNSDEEIGSRESGRYIAALAQQADRALVLEPSMGPAGAIKTARKGVGRYPSTVKGRAAHAGLDPESGVSAILELSHVIQSLFALNDPARGVTVNVGTIDGGLRPNVIAPESRAVVDVRIATQQDAERIDRAIKGLQPSAPGIELHIEGAIGRPALERTPRNRALWRLANELSAEIDLELVEDMAGGGSDGNTTSLYTATLDGLGPVGDGAHAHHEHLDLERTIERAALLALLVLAPPLEELADG